MLIKDIKTKEELDHYEKLWIKKLKTKSPNGYNLTDGGEGNLGWKISESTKRKISNSLIGRKISEGHKNKISNSTKNRPLITEETKLKISESLKKVKHRSMSDETKMKISKSLKGHKVSDVTKKKISSGNVGKIMSVDAKRKISEYQTNKRQNLRKI